MQFDFPLEKLREHRPPLNEPSDFDEFWSTTLAEARSHDIDVRMEEVDLGLAGVATYDFSFAGFGGHRISAWLRVPTDAPAPLPAYVQFHGYRGGRSWAHEAQLWPLAGFAHLSVDTRGQGGGGWNAGGTPDPVGGSGPEASGWLTRGILSPQDAYYRRVFCDAARAVDAVRALDTVDSTKVFVGGVSQGGGIALAAAGLSEGLAGVTADVPFLCDFPEAVALADETSNGYGEIVHLLRTHIDWEETVFRTLSYVDAATLATRATAPALMSVGLMDAVCAPRTVFAAYNGYGSSDKDIAIYPYAGHEGGGQRQEWRKLEWLRSRLG
jgi:cephalosporin-C deacetylase